MVSHNITRSNYPIIKLNLNNFLMLECFFTIVIKIENSSDKIKNKL